MYSKVKKILDREINRQDNTIELIASENFASQAVMDLCGSVFTNKYAEGYSITFTGREAEDGPFTSVLDDDAKIVASPFNNLTFRVAGTAELANWNHEIREDRIKPLVDWVKNNTFMDAENYTKWACLRPMTPNMLPVISKVRGMWINSGAGHLGWTMGMALAEKITKEI